jgi:hypothetical protein
MLGVSLAAAGCSSSSPSPMVGYAYGTPAEGVPFGECDTTTGYVAVNEAACPLHYVGCRTGGDRYAVCDGKTFSMCSCCVPPGYTLITNPTGVPSAYVPARDAGAVEAPTCTGTSTADSGRPG